MTAVNSEGRNNTKWWAKYEEAKSLMRDFSLCEVRKIKRECNVAAHELAAHARIHGDFFLPKNVPPDILHVIENDCTLTMNE